MLPNSNGKTVKAPLVEGLKVDVASGLAPYSWLGVAGWLYRQGKLPQAQYEVAHVVVKGLVRYWLVLMVYIVVYYK